MLSLSPANGKVFSRVCPSMGDILGPRGCTWSTTWSMGCAFSPGPCLPPRQCTPPRPCMHAPWNTHWTTDHTCPLFMNGGQAGDTYPTGMLSCSFFILSTEGPVNIWTSCPVYTQFLTFHIDLFEILK